MAVNPRSKGRGPAPSRPTSATGRAIQRRAATLQWLALAVFGALAVLAAFVLFSGSSPVLSP